MRADGVTASTAIVEEIERMWAKVPLLQWLVSQRAAVGVKPKSPAWSILANLPMGRQSEAVSNWRAALARLETDSTTPLPRVG